MCAVEHKIGVYGKYQTLMNLHTAVIGSFARHNKFFFCFSLFFLFFSILLWNPAVFFCFTTLKISYAIILQ